MVALKVGNKVVNDSANCGPNKNSHKTFEKELTIYHHCLRYKMSGIPRLTDCRVRSLLESNGGSLRDREGNNHSSTSSQRNFLINQLGNNCGLATAR